MSTLTFLSRKIAAQIGDVRSLFEVLRGAIDLAVPQPPADDKATPPVTPPHILAALKAYAPASKVVPAISSTTLVKSLTSSETVCKVRNLGLHAQFALLALVIACRRTETSLPPILSRGNPPRSPVKRSSWLPTPLPTTQAGIEVSQLHTFYSTILTRNETGTFSPVSRSEFTDLAGVLETVGLISPSMAPNGRKMARRAIAMTSSIQVQVHICFHIRVHVPRHSREPAHSPTPRALCSAHAHGPARWGCVVGGQRFRTPMRKVHLRVLRMPWEGSPLRRLRLTRWTKQ